MIARLKARVSPIFTAREGGVVDDLCGAAVLFGLLFLALALPASH